MEENGFPSGASALTLGFDGEVFRGKCINPFVRNTSKSSSNEERQFFFSLGNFFESEEYIVFLHSNQLIIIQPY